LGDNGDGHRRTSTNTHGLLPLLNAGTAAGRSTVMVAWGVKESRKVASAAANLCSSSRGAQGPLISAARDIATEEWEHWVMANKAFESGRRLGRETRDKLFGNGGRDAANKVFENSRRAGREARNKLLGLAGSIRRAIDRLIKKVRP
jgi:hypothetical protein